MPVTEGSADVIRRRGAGCGPEGKRSENAEQFELIGGVGSHAGGPRPFDFLAGRAVRLE
jgi:hypothetical protein